MDSQDRLERLRQLDVDVDALLKAAVSLAETRHDVGAKATQPSLSPDDPANLSKRIYVPAVDEEDVDPVALLETAVAMVRADNRPMLALNVARGGASFFNAALGPLAAVRETPHHLFSPEIAHHVLELLALANRPGPPQWLGSGDELRPVSDHRLPDLPAGLEGDAELVLRTFVETFTPPRWLHGAALESVARALATPPLPAPPPPVDPEDIPLGQPLPPPPRPETEEDAAARLRTELEHEAAWQGKRAAAVADVVLVFRHAALGALQSIFDAALGWRPRADLDPFMVKWAARALESLKAGERERLLADLLGVTDRTIRRKLARKATPRIPFPFEPRHRAAAARSDIEAPADVRDSSHFSNAFSKGEQGAHQGAARKQDAHDEADPQPQPPQTRREAVQLPARRPARTQRLQSEPVAEPDRPRRGPRRPPRKDDPRPSG